MKMRFGRNLVGTGLLIALAMLTACIPSLQPFYSDKDVLFDPNLIGTFADKEGDSVWTFMKGKEREYRLEIKEGKESSLFSAHLFKLENELYLDLYPDQNGLDDCPREAFFKSSLIPGHLVLKVPAIKPALELRVLDQQALTEHLKQNKSAVPHTFIENDRLVFTGTTEQMQAFLKSIPAQGKIWGDPGTFVRRETPAK